MIIGNVKRSTLIDYDGKIAASVFLFGCNFRCPYCHNPDLVLGNLKNRIEEKDFFDFLKTRINKLDGVVISGGEPTCDKGLYEFIKKIKDLGFLVKLDTNGSNPMVVAKLIKDKMVDYIALDIKTSFDEYKKVNGDYKKVQETFETIVKSGIEYEIRTTACDMFLNYDNFVKINEYFLKFPKIKKYCIQKFKRSKHLDNKYMEANTFSDEEFLKLEKLFKDSVTFFMIR